MGGYGGAPPYPPYGSDPELEPPAPPQGTRDGYKRLSNRVFMAPADAATAEILAEMSETHGVTVAEKCAISLTPAAWSDDAAFSADINTIFKVKGGKSGGSKFWKGMREAVMKQCGVKT